MTGPGPGGRRLAAGRRTASLVLGWAGAWVLLSVLAVAGLAWLTTAVEAAGLGPGAAALVALARVPAILVFAGPAVLGLGIGLASARADATGARTALQSSGWSARRSGRVLLPLGLVFGGGLMLGADHLAPVGMHWADQRSGVAPAEWVWLQGEAVRLRDGVRVRWQADRLQLVPDSSPPDPAELALAAHRLRPASAPAAALKDAPGGAAQAERGRRWGRLLGGAGLAYLCWLPLGRTPGRQLLAGLALGGLVTVLEHLVPPLVLGMGVSGLWAGLLMPAVLGALAVLLAATAR